MKNIFVLLFMSVVLHGYDVRTLKISTSGYLMVNQKSPNSFYSIDINGIIQKVEPGDKAKVFQNIDNAKTKDMYLYDGTNSYDATNICDLKIYDKQGKLLDKSKAIINYEKYNCTESKDISPKVDDDSPPSSPKVSNDDSMKHKNDVLVYVKVTDAQLKDDEKFHIRLLFDALTKNPSYGKIFLRYSLRDDPKEYQGNSVALHPLYLTRQEIINENYSFDIRQSLEIEPYEYKKIIVMDTFLDCEKSYDSKKVDKYISIEKRCEKEAGIEYILDIDLDKIKKEK